jgi:steroid 5-alpha reductase family enzyme
MDILLVNIVILGCIIALFVSGVFVLAQSIEDNSVMDIFYGLTFLAAAVFYLTLTDIAGLVPYIITTCIALWSLRLSGRIFLKNFGNTEDARYAAWRTEWMKKGQAYFILRSYLQINLLQGLIILAVLLPFAISITSPDAMSPVFLFLGLVVFFFGLAYETLADYQLDQFIARKKAGTEPATLMTTGLFAYSRRPNYFGETLIWWGQAIMVITLPYGFLALISPLLITFIVTKVTGPMLEKQFLTRYPDEYRTYMASTPYFIPRFTKPASVPPASTQKNSDSTPLPMDAGARANREGQANADSSGGSGGGAD